MASVEEAGAIPVLWGYAMPMEAIAILLTGVAAFVATMFGLRDQRRVARQRVTLEHVARIDRDKDMIEAKGFFIQYCAEAGKLASLAQQISSTEAQYVTRILNNWELISIGIQMDIIDFEVLKRYNKSAIINHWDSASQFVLELRKLKANRMYYHEFEELARWMRDDKMPHRVRGDRFWTRYRWAVWVGIAIVSFIAGGVLLP
jgi:hypothetical protein